MGRWLVLLAVVHVELLVAQTGESERHGQQPCKRPHKHSTHSEESDTKHNPRTRISAVKENLLGTSGPKSHKGKDRDQGEKK